MRVAWTIAAFAALLTCAAAPGEPVTLVPRQAFATSLPIPGEPPRSYSKVTVDAVELRPGARRARLLVKAVFSAPVAGKGADAPRDGWLRAVDEAGLVHLLTPVGAMDASGGPELAVIFQAEVPGAPAVLKLHVGPPLRPDAGLRVDFARKTTAAFKPGREAPALAWPALEQTARGLLPQPQPAPSFAPRLAIPLGSVAAALGRKCLEDVDLLLPAAQFVPGADGRGDSLAVVRVFVNRGTQGGCEVPNDLFYADDVGGVMPAAQAYLAAAPAFASYLDVVVVELPPHAQRGHLFVSEASGETRTEVAAQLRLDLASRSLTRVADVEGILNDEAGSKPIPGVELWLRGSTDWRSDREVVRQVRTGADGRFRFERIEPGKYSVAGRVADGRELREDFVQGTAGVRLKLALASPEPELPPPGFIGVMLREGKGSVYVEEVMPGSAAERAGLKANDRLVSVDGVRVADLEAAHARIPGKPGTSVRIEVARGGARQVLTAVRTPEGRRK